MSSLSTGSITTSRRIATRSTPMRHLSSRGLLLLDDVVPSDELSAHRDLDEAMRLQRVAGVERPLWHGDVYRTVCVLLEHHPDLCVRTIVGSGNPQALIWNARPDVVPDRGDTGAALRVRQRRVRNPVRRRSAREVRAG